MSAVVVPVLVFIVGTAAVFGAYVGVTRLPEFLLRRRLQRRLADVNRAGVEADASPQGTLIKSRVLGPLPAIDRLVVRTARGSALGRWIEQSGLKLSASSVILMSLGSAAVVYFSAAAIVRHPWVHLALAAVGLTIPLVVIRQYRSRRLRKFEEMFPEALDLLSRAVRAGHAFATGLKMVADEIDDPVGPEFRATFDEQNFGLELKDALGNLADRIPNLDVRFFATAVLIQRETGGNLSEILDNLSNVVRERFKILRQVRVYTAHGRLTGYVLLALPAILAVALSFINPDHMNLLFREHMGQMMLMGALLMQVVGYLWIKQIVKIEV